MLDPQKLEKMFEDAEDQMDEIVNMMQKNDDVLFAKGYNYDAIVGGKENHRDYIIDSPETNKKVGASTSKVSFGEPRYDHVRKAIERIRRSENSGSVSSGSTSNVSGAQVLDDITNLNLPDLD